MTETLQLTSAGRYREDGRDWVSIDGIEGFNPRSITPGQVVMISGGPYRVRAVETFAVADATGRPFNLAIDPLI